MAERKSSNDAWRRPTKNKQRRTRGPLDPSMYVNIPSAVLEAKSARKYRYADLQGTERIDMLRQVRDCAMAAMTNFEIAQQFGVEESTLTTWISRDPEFAIAMRLPRELADDRVEKALYSRALGYKFKAEEIKITEAGVVHRVEVIKQVPPDIGAGIFWLKNRRPHLWKERVDVNANVEGSVTVTDDSDPRRLAMAVMDVLQAAIYDKLPVTLEGAPVDSETLAAYSPDELEKMDTEQLERLLGADEDQE